MIKIKLLSRVVLLAVVLLSTLGIIMPVFAPGTGLIRIDPVIPQVVSSPATFSIWVQDGSTAYDPQILLVMTQTSYNSWVSGTLGVAWSDGSISIPKGDFATPGIHSKLPPGTTPGAGYNVASLKSHLGETEEEIWWVSEPILGLRDLEADDIDEEYITITFPASSPHMMVYVLGRSSPDSDYDLDMKVPPTSGGMFLIPEVPYGTIATMITMLGAFYVFYAKRG